MRRIDEYLANYSALSGYQIGKVMELFESVSDNESVFNDNEVKFKVGKVIWTLIHNLDGRDDATTWNDTVKRLPGTTLEVISGLLDESNGKLFKRIHRMHDVKSIHLTDTDMTLVLMTSPKSSTLKIKVKYSAS